MEDDSLDQSLMDPLVGELTESLPTVTTDKQDYAPGETVTITARGFEAGSTITLAIADDPNDPGDDGDADVYQPFSITDGGEGDLDGVANGQIITTWIVPKDNNGTGSGTPDALNATLILTATGDGIDHRFGTIDDQVATTTFTDADTDRVPVQFFYVPFPEDQLLQGLQAIEAGSTSPDPVNPVQTYISIAAIANNTIVYYDQWENGYDGDIANPLNLYSTSNLGGTQIWGDGNTANGAAPGVTTNAGDVINAGTVIVLNNSVSTTNLSAIDFDGRDKIAATQTIAVTKTGWASGSNTLLAGSVEVFDTNNWGTDYRAPVGVNIPDATDFQMFEYTSLAIMAGEGGALISFDNNNDGDFLDTGEFQNQILLEGESRFINGGVNVGAKVSSDKPVQVDILTGDIGSSYESRDSALLPTNLWSSSYYTPVSTPDQAQERAGTDTTVWLYNPGTSQISVTYERRESGVLTSSTITVPGGTAGGYVKQIIPDGSGAHFFTLGNEKFYAFSTTNSTDTNTNGNQAWDWGFSLIPQDSLTPQVLIGLGIGRDPTSSISPNENGNPVWVTPVGNGETAVDVYVDFDANPSTGSLTDPNGNKYDQKLSLKELERAKVYDTDDGNQTGTLIYTLGSGVKLAAAWGQDPTTANRLAPGLDVGTGVVPLPLFSAGKNGTLSDDKDNSGNVSPGDEIIYKIVVNNTSRAPVPNILLKDNLPADTTYVANSTTFKNALGVTTPIADDADDGSGTAFPLDGSGSLLDNVTALPVGGSYEVTFKVTIDSFPNLTPGTTQILNTGSATAVGTTIPFSDTTPLNFSTNINIEKFTNAEDADSETGPFILVGSPVTWTYNVTTTGNVWLSGISVTDSVSGVNPTAVDANYDGKNDGDTNQDNILQPGETWLYQATGTATPGQYSNIGTATGNPVYNDGTTPIPGLSSPSDTDWSHYFGAAPSLTIDKFFTNADDAIVDTAGETIEYTIVVDNTGNVDLTNVVLTDAFAGGATLTSGDTNTNNILETTETWTYTADYVVTQADLNAGGTLTNVATVDTNQTDPQSDDAISTVQQNPSLTIDKVANNQSVTAAGQVINYTYTVTNTGNQTLTGVTLSDDNFTPSNTGDDFNPIFFGGDINGDNNLDVGESWIYTASHTVTQAEIDAGTNLVNVATADSNQTEPKTDTETVEIPQNDLPTNIEIDKVTTNGTLTGDGITVAAGSAIQWIYTVKNTGVLSLNNVSVTDDNGTSGDPSDDFQATLNTSTDVGNDGILSPNETWTYTYSSTAVAGSYNNIGTVTSETVSLSDNRTPTANDSSSYTGESAITPPGVRTPGFWQNTTWQRFWDGHANNQPAQAGTTNFPTGDLFHSPYTNSATAGQVLDPVTNSYQIGLLIGDYNRNGMTDTGEDTLFYTLDQARKIVDSSQHPKGGQKDDRYTLGRDLVASWLNYLAGNPIDTANSTDKDARYYINEAVDWLQALTPDENGDQKGDGALNQLVNSTVNSPTVNSYWNTGITSATGLPSPYNLNTAAGFSLDAGNTIHTQLDKYNNGLGLADGVFHGG